MGEKHIIYKAPEKINTFHPLPKYHIREQTPPTQPTFDKSALINDLKGLCQQNGINPDVIQQITEIVNKHADEGRLQL